MKKILLLIIAFIVMSVPQVKAEGNQIFYISPGVGISWNFSGEFILSPKFSLGMFENGMFYNVTFGWGISKENEQYPYYYVEFQTGGYYSIMQINNGNLPLCSGIGIGLAFHDKGNQTKTMFKAQVFSGFLLFVKGSFLYDDKWYPDIGLEGVIPLPAFGNSHISVGG